MSTSISPIRRFQIARNKYNSKLNSIFDEYTINIKSDLKEIAEEIYYEQTQIALNLYKHALQEYYDEQK